jgi:hypothetical protein
VKRGVSASRSLWLLLFLLGPRPVVAQTPWSGSQTSTYLPFGATGGFVPYAPGPGQGLGVTARGSVMGVNPTRAAMAMPGQRAELGQSRGYLSPLAPIGTMRRAGMGQGGMSGPLIRPMPSGAVMGGMTRPPVGGYPFRIPPPLVGPAAATPGMSM